MSFRSGRVADRPKVVSKGRPANDKQTLSIVSYDCTNIKTSTQAISDLIQGNQILLIQEHWLFQCLFDFMGEMDGHVLFVGKETYLNDAIHPTQMPRGYGGVAVLWHSDIDHLIKPLDDGGERIQCVEVKVSGNNKLLIVSDYLPTKGGADSVMDYQACLDQLHEIFQIYQTTHHFVIDDDLNKDLTINGATSKRLEYLTKFIKELDSKYTCAGKTFMNFSKQI